MDASPPTEQGFKAIRKQVLDKLEKDYLEQALRRFGGRYPAGGRGHGTDPAGGVPETERIRARGIGVSDGTGQEYKSRSQPEI
jgi:hypothetical protein